MCAPCTRDRGPTVPCLLLGASCKAMTKEGVTPSEVSVRWHLVPPTSGSGRKTLKSSPPPRETQDAASRSVLLYFILRTALPGSCQYHPPWSGERKVRSHGQQVLLRLRGPSGRGRGDVSGAATGALPRGTPPPQKGRCWLLLFLHTPRGGRGRACGSPWKTSTVGTQGGRF